MLKWVCSILLPEVSIRRFKGPEIIIHDPIVSLKLILVWLSFGKVKCCSHCGKLYVNSDWKDQWCQDCGDNDLDNHITGESDGLMIHYGHTWCPACGRIDVPHVNGWYVCESCMEDMFLEHEREVYLRELAEGKKQRRVYD